MDVILLEKVRNLGSLGEQVKVKPGFARNFLIPTARRYRPAPKTAPSSRRVAPSSRRPRRTRW